MSFEEKKIICSPGLVIFASNVVISSCLDHHSHQTVINKFYWLYAQVEILQFILVWKRSKNYIDHVIEMKEYWYTLWKQFVCLKTIWIWSISKKTNLIGCLWNTTVSTKSININILTATKTTKQNTSIMHSVHTCIHIFYWLNRI